MQETLNKLPKNLTGSFRPNIRPDTKIKQKHPKIPQNNPKPYSWTRHTLVNTEPLSAYTDVRKNREIEKK
jgi:hypothetical protein